MARGSGTVTVKILGDASSLNGALNQAEGRIGKFAKAGGVAIAGIGAAAAGAAVGLFKIGESFDAASDKIRVGTGATGGALKGLESDFKAVIKNVPADFDSASTAIADLNTRLGLTGQPLQTLAGNFLDLSRITGTDVTQNIESVTRAFGDWGVQAEDQNRALNAIFRASQATGAGVDTLAQQVVQFGAPLRQLGFGFEESLATLGKFEKEGVNAELVMGSLRIALGKMAREGEPAVETFRRVVDEIKNSGDASTANAKALELFGARAGPDMAAAIREGRFELGDLLDTVKNGSDTIFTAARDTEDFGEKWTRLKNRVFVALQPIASKVFDAVGSGMDKLGQLAEKVVPIVSQLATVLFKGDFRGGPFAEDSKVVDVMFDIRDAALGLGRVVSRVFDSIRNAVRAGVDFIDRFRGSMRDGESDVSRSVARIRGVVEQLRDTFKSAFDAVAAIVETAVKIISELWERVGPQMIESLKRQFDNVIETLDGVLRAVKGVFDVFAGIFTGDWGRVWEGIKGVFGGVWKTIQGLARIAIENVRIAITGGLGLLSAGWSAVWNGMKTFFSDIWEGIKNIGRAAINFLIDRVNTLIDGLNQAADLADKLTPGDTFGQIPHIPRVEAPRQDVSSPPGQIPVAGAFAEGGVVPGPPGSPQLILAHGGETVLPADEPQPAPLQIIVHNHGDAPTLPALEMALRRAAWSRAS